jgi:hypothetical protein
MGASRPEPAKLLKYGIIVEERRCKVRGFPRNRVPATLKAVERNCLT